MNLIEISELIALAVFSGAHARAKLRSCYERCQHSCLCMVIASITIQEHEICVCDKALNELGCWRVYEERLSDVEKGKDVSCYLYSPS